MEDRLLQKTTIFTLIYTVIALSVMIVFFVYREVPVNAESGNTVSGTIMGTNNQMLNPETGPKTTEYLCIPLPEGAGEEQVSISSNCMTRTLSLSVSGVSSDFYYRHSLSGCSNHISNLMYGYGNNMARIDLILDSVYEYESIFDQGNMYLKFLAPKEFYRKIVVLDAGHGGEETGTTAYGQTESEIDYDVVKRVCKLLDDTDIKYYCTRAVLEDNPSTKERLALAHNTKADIMVCVHVNADAKTRVTNGIQVIYPTDVFIPKYDSKMLATTMEEAMKNVAGPRSQGCVSGNNIELLKEATIPTVYVELGYLTNRQDALNLGKESHRDKLAKGIFDGIVEAFEEIDVEGEIHE